MPSPEDSQQLLYLASDNEAKPMFNPGVGWWAVLIAAKWFLWDDAPTLNERTGYGPVRVWVAQVGYGLIAVRAVAALLLRDRSWWWFLYAVLLLTVGPLIILVVQLSRAS
jgi:hypothetical protein